MRLAGFGACSPSDLAGGLSATGMVVFDSVVLCCEEAT